jgi:hypothetical protein
MPRHCAAVRCRDVFGAVLTVLLAAAPAAGRYGFSIAAGFPAKVVKEANTHGTTGQPVHNSRLSEQHEITAAVAHGRQLVGPTS